MAKSDLNTNQIVFLALIFKFSRIYVCKALTILGFSSDVSCVLIIFLPDNLSENKIAQQYKTSSNCLTCVATKAVDKDINTCTKVEDIGTTSAEKITWWYVDLEDRYNVYNIRIQFKDYDGHCKY